MIIQEGFSKEVLLSRDLFVKKMMVLHRAKGGHSGKREQQVPRPWGGNKLGVFKKPKG